MVVSDHCPNRLLRYFECNDLGSDNFTSFECRIYTAAKHQWQDNIWGEIGGTGWDDEGYNDVPELNGSYFVYVCVRDPERDQEVEARKEAKHRRNKRMGTVPLLEISRHRESEIGVGGGS